MSVTAATAGSRGRQPMGRGGHVGSRAANAVAANTRKPNSNASPLLICKTLHEPASLTAANAATTATACVAMRNSPKRSIPLRTEQTGDCLQRQRLCHDEHDPGPLPSSGRSAPSAGQRADPATFGAQNPAIFNAQNPAISMPIDS